MNGPPPAALRLGIEAQEEGYALSDAHGLLRTPGDSVLAVPTRALAEAIAEEWYAAPKEPRRRALTRLANTAIDRVRPGRQGFIAALVNYAHTDLLCYRSATEPRLAAREAAAWDPFLAWAAEALGVGLSVTGGLIPRPQPAQAIAALERRLAGESAFVLAGLHAAAGLTSSVVLALALRCGHSDAGAVWAAARLEEAWQAERWGLDPEAEARARRGQAELELLARFFALLA